MTVYVGVDWGKKETAFVFGADEESKCRRTVVTCASELQGIVQSIRRRAKDAAVVVAIEHGAPATTRMLFEAGFAVHVVDGKQLKRYRESLTSSGTNNDELSAYWAWRMAQSPGHLKTPYQPLTDDAQLFATTLRVLDWIGKNVTQANNQLRALLTEQIPDIEAALSSLKAAYCRDLIREVPTTWHAAQFTEDQWKEFVARHRVPKKKYASLRNAIRAAGSRNTMGADIAEEFASVIYELVGRLEDLQKREQALERRLDALAAEDDTAELASSVPGIGTRTSSRLATEVFSAEHRERAEQSKDPRDYAARRTLCAPVEDKTGTTRNRVHRRRGGSRAAGVAAVRAAAQAKMRIGWARAMYAHHRSRGGSHYTALRKVARSLMRILTAMIRDGTQYDDVLYVERLKQKGVVWAMDL